MWKFPLVLGENALKTGPSRAQTPDTKPTTSGKDRQRIAVKNTAIIEERIYSVTTTKTCSVAQKHESRFLMLQVPTHMRCVYDL